MAFKENQFNVGVYFKVSPSGPANGHDSSNGPPKRTLEESDLEIPESIGRMVSYIEQLGEGSSKDYVYYPAVSCREAFVNMNQ